MSGDLLVAGGILVGWALGLVVTVRRHRAIVAALHRIADALELDDDWLRRVRDAAERRDD